MMHLDIKRFYIEGEVGEAHLTSCRDNFERWLLTDMRDNGYVPHLDLGSVFTIQWKDAEKFQFMLSMYGVYVGDNSKDIEGLSDGRFIHRSPSGGGIK